LNSCIGHATGDPRITARYTFEQIYKTCVCVKDYYTYSYSHEEMTDKLSNYTDAIGEEIAQVTAQCLMNITRINSPSKSNDVTKTQISY